MPGGKVFKSRAAITLLKSIDSISLSEEVESWFAVQMKARIIDRKDPTIIQGTW